MREFISALAILWAAVFYWLGGQALPYFNRGFKWLRRFVLPLGLAIFLITLGAPWWKSLLSCAGLCAALHIGYGTSLFRYLLAGCVIALPSAILGLHWTIILPPIFHTLFGYLSLKDNRFGWNAVAILMGTAIGITYITTIN